MVTGTRVWLTIAPPRDRASGTEQARSALAEISGVLLYVAIATRSFGRSPRSYRSRRSPRAMFTSGRSRVVGGRFPA
jgi:hypothetical protein